MLTLFSASSTIGGFTTFLFGAVAVSGVRVLAYAKWTRRDRFIATTCFALGLASLCVPNWFSYIFTYKGSNAGLNGLIQAVILIVEEPYLIAALVGVGLNATLPDEPEDEKPEGEAEGRDWNEPPTLVGPLPTQAQEIKV
jgi:NCS2 family nucleobase:cation symporter-2